MDLLKAEIARKRSITEAIRSQQQSTTTTEGGGGAGEGAGGMTSRFIRQRDQQQFLQKQLEAEQAKLDAEREALKRQRLEVEDKQTLSEGVSQHREEDEKNKKHSQEEDKVDSNNKKKVHNRKHQKEEEEEESDYRQSTMSLEVKKDKQREKYRDLFTASVADIKGKLRALKQPITLFGESATDRVERLLHYLVIHGVDPPPTATTTTTSSSSSATPSMKVEERDRELGRQDKEEEQEEEEQEEEEEEEEEDGEEVGESRQKVRGYDPSIHYSEMPQLSREKVVYKFFKSLIKQWELDLENRPDHEKRVAKGKLETRAWKRCKDYIRPLFKMCKQKAVPGDILHQLFEMVKHCEEGDFRAANNVYIRTAIGNSAWPIGLTMVGIHERSGRERISTSKVAHIMNNELERKYLTSCKTLMTFAQNKRPDVPPSKKVLT